MVYAVRNVESGEYYRLRADTSVKVLKWLEAFSTLAVAKTVLHTVEEAMPELMGKLYVLPVPVDNTADR
jgi:hypothetical protein